jgi:alkylhydroperoxidase family enzyme
MVRISPAPQAEWPEEIATFIAGFRSAARGGAPAEGRPSGANLLGTLVRHPALAKAFLTFNGHVLSGSTLSYRQRELLILRVAFLRQCGYEWAQHVLRGKEAGLRDDEVARIGATPDAPGWSAVDRSLLMAADELIADGTVSGDTWAALAGEFDEQQLMDVVFTVGTYELVAMALRSFDVQPEAELLPHLLTDR